MGRNPCCSNKKLRKGLWSPEEDEKLAGHIARFGVSCWSSIPELTGLQRCGKSCRLRWMNYLRPDLKRGRFSPQEEELIMSLHESLGNSWSQIAAQLPGRSDNEIKNFWNARLRKKNRQKETERKEESLCRDGEADRKPQVFNPFLQVSEDHMSAARSSSNTVSNAVGAEARRSVVADADENVIIAMLGEYLDGSQDGLFWEGLVFS